MAAVADLLVGQQLINELNNLAIIEKSALRSGGDNDETCAICFNEIVLQDMALVKGCEHAYCVTCLLQWASYNEENPTCPQCKHPFQFLNIHRALDGSLYDYMFEENVHLLLTASWFKPLKFEQTSKLTEELDDYHYYHYDNTYEDDQDQEDLDDTYYGHSSNLRIGNRRWGDNGYVRSGRVEARPVSYNLAGPSGDHNKKKGTVVGRRAKRTLKREAAERAAEKELLAMANIQG